MLNVTSKWLQQQIDAGKTAEMIATETGKGKSTIYTWIRQLGVKLPSRDLPAGARFGRLVIVNRKGSKSGEAVYRCRCDCGGEKPVRRSNLVAGGTSSCGCQQYLTGKDNPLFKGHGEIGGKYWSNIQQHARTRNLSFDLTITQAWNIYTTQKGLCALSGLPIAFVRLRLTVQTASLDRIDSGDGYCPDNAQWVHKDINRMKMCLPEKRFVLLCRLVAVTQC